VALPGVDVETNSARDMSGKKIVDTVDKQGVTILIDLDPRPSK
jgi:hypothetical protein